MSSGPAALQRKQMRHCWFTLMLYCPERSPCSFSSRLPGGIPASSRVSAASRINSLRSAARWCAGRADVSARVARLVRCPCRRKNAARTNITQRVIIAPRYGHVRLVVAEPITSCTPTRVLPGAGSTESGTPSMTAPDRPGFGRQPPAECLQLVAKPTAGSAR